MTQRQIPETSIGSAPSELHALPNHQMPFTVLVYQDGVSLFSAEKPLYCFFRFLPLKLNRTQRNHVISIGGAQCHIQRNPPILGHLNFNGRTQLIVNFHKKLPSNHGPRSGSSGSNTSAFAVWQKSCPVHQRPRISWPVCLICTMMRIPSMVS